MSARSGHRLGQSNAAGLEDAGMDLRTESNATRTSSRDLDSFAFLVLLWLRKQMSREKEEQNSDGQNLPEEGAACLPDKSTVCKEHEDSPKSIWVHSSGTKATGESELPKNVQRTRKTYGLDRRMTSMRSPSTSSSSSDHVHGRVKGLLERRGSSASLTIELTQASDTPLPHTVTPTRECTAEEFLLSAGNVLSRTELMRSICDPRMLHKEFWEVPLNFPEKVDVCGSGVKNRYRTILPNPRSRVILPGSDDPLSSYINANYIRGYDQDIRYIATQGPLSHTIEDFWKMVWEERAPVVVMITRLHEADKAKCDAYFPVEKNNRIQTGPYTITVSSVDSRDGFTVRDFQIRYEGDRRNVQHYWYDSWPDHAVPQAADTLVSLAAEVNAWPGPIVVHCSAGIGRTGCFIALATGMTQLVRDGSVDILGILCQMRYDRGGMVQTAEQYEFIHRALCLFEQTLDKSLSCSPR